MMTRTLCFNVLFLLAFVTAASAGDTTQTPTPAQVITATVTPNNDVEAVIQNAGIAAKMIRLNPRAASFVQDYTNKNKKDLVSLREMGIAHFRMMDQILEQHGLPTELKYLSVIESRLNTRAISSAGAAGPWQFMPSTAKLYGLKITKSRDERRDYAKSTHAAAKYLKSLYNQFGDWLLVIAAYNGGPGYVYSAIKKSRSRNFWDLQYYLPAESRNHVKKFISTHYIFEGTGGICTLTKAEAAEQIGSLAGYLLNRNLTAEELKEATTTTISGKYRAAIIAKYVNMDMDEFNRYNPMFDKMIDEESNTYELKLPAENMDKFVSNKYPILNESVQVLLTEPQATASELSKKQQTTAIK